MEQNLLENIDKSSVPKHVAIIMDGNGRWAKNKGEQRVFGHINGVESVRNSLAAATKAGVKYLTLYAFSSENWSRPKEEVDALMDLLVNTILGEVEGLNKNGVRLHAIGNLKGLPSNCAKTLEEAIELTKNNTVVNLVLALNYGAKEEITSAFKTLAAQVKNNELQVEDITEELITKALYTSAIPDPDLIIRTSGEQRISNFLLWQCAYSEFFFTETLWPDFNEQAFFEAILNYQSRERRFGKTSEQITS